jgi:hypothetical protein
VPEADIIRKIKAADTFTMINGGSSVPREIVCFNVCHRVNSKKQLKGFLQNL